MLITGVSGLLGNNLAYYFKDKFEVLGLYNQNPVNINGIQTDQCQITDFARVNEIIAEFNPDIILHCASLTNVDECEINKELTKKVNVIGTKNIVGSVSKTQTHIIYISSDSVYDGIKGNFSEKDEVNPQNYYGESKYKGELEVSQHPKSLILRTNLFGWNIQSNKSSLGEWVIRELSEKRKIHGFKDAFFSTIYTKILAEVIYHSALKNIVGTYNCGSIDSCSKYDFAVKIADWFKLDKPLIIPSSIEDFDFKAKRGKDLSLNVAKINEILGYQLPTVDQSVNAFYEDNRMHSHIINGKVTAH
jgi:dTDP-4-dehydrorhamnose reductase